MTDIELLKRLAEMLRTSFAGATLGDVEIDDLRAALDRTIEEKEKAK